MDTSTDISSQFAWRVYSRLAESHASENLFFSPFSFQVALAMCAAGARTLTRRVLAKLLGVPQAVEEQNRQYAQLLKSINAPGEWPFQLVTANALWGQQGSHFNPDFRAAVAASYGGAFQEVNFRSQPDEAVRTINSWVRGKTKEKIKDLIQRDSVNEGTRLILTNAIYFKGEWQNVFPRHRTNDEEWHGVGGRRKVAMMHRTGSYSYYQGNGFQALELLYRGGQQSMVIALPERNKGLASLEGKWVNDRLDREVGTGLQHEGRVVVSIPRFRIEAEYKLKPALCELGADIAFSDRADFGGIGSEPLKISEVVHKAFVDVNEEGTEAAAATDVGMLYKGIRVLPPPKVFNADHPFLFFIQDRKTKAVLFSGRVLDPG